MPSGNGNRAMKKRERNQKDAAAKTSAKSQLKTNEKAKQAFVCNICRQSFMNTTKESELRLHHSNKHDKVVSVLIRKHISHMSMRGSCASNRLFVPFAANRHGLLLAFELSF